MTSVSSRWRLPAIAIMIALAATLTSTTNAMATEPGEGPNWLAQTFNDGRSDRIIHSTDTMAEAITTNTGGNPHRVRVWRGTDDDVWLSVDGSIEFPPTVGRAVTHVAPRVVWDGARMHIYHTGTDGRVFVSTNYDFNRLGDPYEWSPWSEIGVPNLRTQQSVSVVHLTGHGTQMYIAWRGYDGSDPTIYGAFYNGSWGPPIHISNGRSWYAPTLTWNESRARIYAYIAGIQSQQIFYAYQDYGHAWTSFSQLGSTPVTSLGSPAAATLSNGDMEIAYTGTDHQVYHGWWPRWANFNNWSLTSGSMRSNWAPYVIAIANYAYLEVTRQAAGGNPPQAEFKVGLQR